MTALLEPGQWGLFCGRTGSSLVAANGEPMGPSSARKSVTLLPRRLLLDTKIIEQAFGSNEAPADSSAELNGETWALRFRPIFSPRTFTAVGCEHCKRSATLRMDQRFSTTSRGNALPVSRSECRFQLALD
nr:hypothetical protein PCFP21_230 [Curtobacterium flaccumfaciens pv. poinsettiae]WQM79204.1 hypothetical protein PCFP23_275 [Curtobacterium flaccumfaciens pv. poinsettiae]WQM79332.1 hypothetical protein PCFP24_410 [Curtobacterium flaccumfaciens pv. poinsettiae]WQM79407.1 hypothetical protein PCFP11_300 [Curtobacterium flaccumfaciens pv. poinsettiae]WQM79442.1 hypothetical protein PCFP31_040 [Curtobacterium flaccumfaciens pv. poinsettiae]